MSYTSSLINTYVEPYLFTFCPPAPDDLLKVTSPKLRGIVLMSNLASHCLAAEWSNSVYSLAIIEPVDRLLESCANLESSQKGSNVTDRLYAQTFSICE